MAVRVFLVEDLHNLQALMRELFASLGGIRLVATATTEAEARLWLSEHRGDWDLAVVDLVLDQGSGFGVLSHAQALGGAGQLVVFSSYVSPGIESHCRQLGAAAVFPKDDSLGFVRWISAQAGGGSPPP